MRNELIADYICLNECPSINEKRALATKYGIDTKNAKEIQHMILVAMRGERKTRNEFDEIDLLYFSKFDIPETYTKARPYYELESIEFLKFVLNNHWKTLVKRKLEKKADLVNTRGTYQLSGADKYAIRRYLNIKKYLDEIKPENIKKKQNDDEINNIIRNILLKDMIVFHDTYIERIKKWATKQYPRIIETINTTRAQLDNLPNEVQYNVWRQLKTKYDTAVTLIKRFDRIEKFVEYHIDNAEKQYMNDINSVVLRIRRKELDYNNLKITNIFNDPKFFEMTITDGNQSLHARSIWAAEYSEKVTAHYRFIIS